MKRPKSPNKRMKVLRLLKKYSPDIVFLQETHLVETDFYRMAKLWVEQTYWSHAVQGNAGVLILIPKIFTHSFFYHEHDSEGMESIVRMAHEGKEIAQCNIYDPNGENKGFFQNLGVKIQGLNATSLILGGDLNTAHSPLEDRKLGDDSKGTPSYRASDNVLQGFLQVTGLRDVWRDVHPEGRDFTFFSHARQSWSRIDYLLLSAGLAPRLQSADIGPLIISDHAPVIIRIADTYPRGSDNLWHFPTYLATTKGLVA